MRERERESRARAWKLSTAGTTGGWSGGWAGGSGSLRPASHAEAGGGQSAHAPVSSPAGRWDGGKVGLCDGGTVGRRDSGTAGQRDGGTAGRREAGRRTTREENEESGAKGRMTREENEENDAKGGAAGRRDDGTISNKEIC